MHFNIYIDDATGQQLTRAAEQSGETRNALIRKALREWLERQGQPAWPETVLEFQGIPELPGFESTRDRLAPPVDDPLA